MKLDAKNMTKEQYREWCRTNSNDMVRTRAETGEHLGMMPMGYKWVRVGSRRRGRSYGEVDYAMIPVVQEIFTLYATRNYTLDTLARAINIKHGIPISGSKIHNILRNPFYIGKIKSKTGELRDHRYPTFIDTTLFEQVQKVLISRQVQPIKLKSKAIFGLWRSLLRCGECDSAITVERKKSIVYYICTQYKVKHNAPRYNEFNLTMEIYKACKKMDIKDDLFKKSYVPHDVFNNFQSNREFVHKHFDYIYIDQDGSIRLILKGMPSCKDIPTFTNELHKQIYFFCQTPQLLDAIVMHTHKELSEIQTLLIDLELEGIITQVPGGLWKAN